jgi:hypothetical protein
MREGMSAIRPRAIGANTNGMGSIRRVSEFKAANRIKETRT